MRMLDDLLKFAKENYANILGVEKNKGRFGAVTHAERTCEKFGDACRFSLMGDISNIWSRTESEIERILLPSLAVMEVPAFFDWSRSWPYARAGLSHLQYDKQLHLEPKEEYFGIYAQAPVLDGRYRADFLLVAMYHHSTEPVLVVIECDGHDFHERTKEQAARDRQRDRDMTAAGYKVFRFTGSEIYRDPNRCAAEISKFLHNDEYSKRPE